MPSAGKVDLFREHRDEYAASRAPRLVDAKEGLYLAVAGRGRPGGKAFQAAVGALYGAAWTIKMARRGGRDFKVAPLEGLYGGGRAGEDVLKAASDTLRWKLLIRVPGFVTEKDLSAATAALAARGRGGSPRVRLERIEEGRCVQALHVGPYATEPTTLERMTAFAHREGLALRGRHHEIYLSDPRRVEPARLRTILRARVKGAGRAPGRALRKA